LALPHVRSSLESGSSEDPIKAVVAVIAIAIGVAVTLAVVAAFIARRLGRDQTADLGQVSSQWVMEHRSTTGYDTSLWHRR
jgi:multisubunit Na+/H+ antiporter MnhC subunit